MAKPTKDEFLVTLVLTTPEHDRWTIGEVQLALETSQLRLENKAYTFDVALFQDVQGLI